jgi:diguanylate cyclase (GGDEF)-like protein
VASEDWKTRITKVSAVSKLPEGHACLVWIYPSDAEIGKRIELEKDELTIGRGSEVDITIDRDSVSRRHAKIVQTGSQYAIIDLGSTNGTYVNDEPVSERTLRDGDLVKIGNAIYKFLSGGNVESAYHEEIYKLTIVDGLTQAHNKRYFMEFLERELARVSRTGRPLSLVMFDIDHFKVINDTHGHLTGDAILKDLCTRIRTTVRTDELLARYGGEEFVVVLPEANHEGGLEFAERIRDLVEAQPFTFEGDIVTVTISVGCATTMGETVSVTQFIKEADDNLYRAKRGGRNMVVG